MPEPSVSVVMPIYQTRQDYVRDAIASLIAQDLSDWELIIVEDPSASESTLTVESFDDSRIHYFRNAERTSLISQRNLALAKCRAPLVAMLDADDVAEPNRLAEQMTFFAANSQTDVLGCQLTIIDTQGTAIAKRTYPQNHDAISRGMRFRNMIPQPGVMFRKERIVQARAYTYDRHAGLEDYDLWCRLLKSGIRFANHPNRLQRYRIHSSQIKQSRLQDQILGTIAVKRLHFANQLGLLGWARIACEYALTYLPASFVMRLFSASYFKSR